MRTIATTAAEDLHDMTDRELYRLAFNISEVLVARAKCRLSEEAGTPAPVAMARRMAQDSVGGYQPDSECPTCGYVAEDNTHDSSDDNYGAW